MKIPSHCLETTTYVSLLGYWYGAFLLYVTNYSITITCIHKGLVLQAQGMCKLDMMPNIEARMFNLLSILEV